jgi:hypothetical protein
LSSSATATVTVSRNGQPQEVNLNLANLNLDADSGENSPAAPAGGTDQAAGAGPAASPIRGHAGGNPNLSTAPSLPPSAAGTINGADAPAPPAGSGNASGERDR